MNFTYDNSVNIRACIRIKKRNTNQVKKFTITPNNGTFLFDDFNSEIYEIIWKIIGNEAMEKFDPKYHADDPDFNPFMITWKGKGNVHSYINL